MPRLAWRVQTSVSPTLPLYRGHFGPAEAERLLWRAGFGPRPGEAQALAKLGLDGAVHSLTHPRAEQLVGRRRTTRRAGRSRPRRLGPRPPLVARPDGAHVRPLVERMTLVWHDWFATSNDGVGSQRLMLNQNELFRQHGLGSFHDLLLDVTKRPGDAALAERRPTTRRTRRTRTTAREMMELFTLGADAGYTESDVREQARALTGWSGTTGTNGVGDVNFRYDPNAHDAGDEDDLRQERQLHAGRTRAGSASQHPTTRRSSSKALELLRPGAARRARPQRALEQLYTRRATRSGRSSRRSSCIPRSTTGRGW